MDSTISRQDADRVFRLVEECCEMWDDPPAWQRHVAGAVEHLIGGFFGVLLRQVANPPASRKSPQCDWSKVTWRTQEYDAGDAIDASTQAVLVEFMTNGGPRQVPDIGSIRQRLLDDGSCSFRHETLTDANGYRRRFFERYMKPIHARDSLYAFAFCSDSSYTMLAVHREHTDRRFSERDSTTLETLTRAVASRTGVRLSTRLHRGRHDLSGRQRQALDRLLAGDSEKQVAAHLGVSVTTAHEYVKALHRYYGVQSRGELMAYHLRRSPVGAR